MTRKGCVDSRRGELEYTGGVCQIMRLVALSMRNPSKRQRTPHPRIPPQITPGFHSCNPLDLLFNVHSRRPYQVVPPLLQGSPRQNTLKVRITTLHLPLGCPC